MSAHMGLVKLFAALRAVRMLLTHLPAVTLTFMQVTLASRIKYLPARLKLGLNVKGVGGGGEGGVASSLQTEIFAGRAMGVDVGRNTY